MEVFFRTAIAPTDLGAVLAGLGLARALDVATVWQVGRLWVACPLAEATDYIARAWAPPAVVSPWNSGTSLWGGKSRAKPLMLLGIDMDARTRPLRDAYGLAQLADAPPANEAEKAELISLAAWSDIEDLELWTAACWRREPPKLPPPSTAASSTVRRWKPGAGEWKAHMDLGSGGNFGRTDLADVHLGAVARTLLAPSHKDPGGSAEALTAWLTGAPYRDYGDPYAVSAGPLFAARTQPPTPWEYMLCMSGAAALGVTQPIDWPLRGAAARPWVRHVFTLDASAEPSVADMTGAAAEGSLRRFALRDFGNSSTRYYAARLWIEPCDWVTAAATLIDPISLADLTAAARSEEDADPELETDEAVSEEGLSPEQETDDVA